MRRTHKTAYDKVAEATFADIRKKAIEGISVIAESAKLRLFFRGTKNPSFAHLYSLRFTFMQNMDVNEHVDLTSAVADIAELLTIATRNGWEFKPQLLVEILDPNRGAAYYCVPVPIEHAAVLRRIATEEAPEEHAESKPKPKS